MTSHICRGHLRGVEDHGRGACSLELDEAQSLMLTLGKSLQSLDKRRRALGAGRAPQEQATADSHRFPFERLPSGDGRRWSGLRLDGAPDGVW